MHVSKQQTEICIKPTTTSTSTNLKEQNKKKNLVWQNLWFFAMVLKNEAVNIHVYVGRYCEYMCYELLSTLLLLYYMVYFITCYQTKKKENEFCFAVCCWYWVWNWKLSKGSIFSCKKKWNIFIHIFFCYFFKSYNQKIFIYKCFPIHESSQLKVNTFHGTFWCSHVIKFPFYTTCSLFHPFLQTLLKKI